MYFTVWGHSLDQIGIWKCSFLRRGENRRTERKTFQSKDENQQQTKPTYDTESGNRTRAALVGGECSHHCAILATQYSLNVFQSIRTKTTMSVTHQAVQLINFLFRFAVQSPPQYFSPYESPLSVTRRQQTLSSPGSIHLWSETTGMKKPVPE